MIEKIMKTPLNKNLENLAVVLFGLCWVFTGIKTLFKPIYYFRGAYVDFTGYHIKVGVALIIIGAAFTGSYFLKKK